MRPWSIRLLVLPAAAALAVALPSLVSHAQQPAPAPSASPSAAAPAAPAAAIDPRADEILRKMGATLQAAQRISFAAHAIIDQTTDDGQRVQYAKNQKVQVRRPDKLAGDVTGDLEDLQFRYNGKEVAIYNPRTSSWGAIPAPPTIEATLDMLATQYGLVMPLADLAFPDPYKVLIENARRGEYLGIGYVLDTKCHHLAFRQAYVDWQIWIQDGDQPLPRKVVITFKDQPGQPQYTAFLSDWKLSSEAGASASGGAGDDAFTLKPPAGAKKVDFAPATPPPPPTPAAPATPATPATPGAR